MAAVSMFYLTVVLKKRDIIYSGFDSKRNTVFVIHFDAARSHGMDDPGALDTGVKSIAQLILIIAMQFATQKGGHVIGFNGMNCGAAYMPINGFYVFMFLKTISVAYSACRILQ